MPASALTRKLIEDGLQVPDTAAIWQGATDTEFADFIERLTSRDPTIVLAIREAARRLRGRRS